MADRSIVSGERQDISTAPRDGTRVLLFHRLAAQESKLCSTSGVFEQNRWKINQGFLIEVRGRVLFTLEPTHWQPLPAPPSTTGGQP